MADTPITVTQAAITLSTPATVSSINTGLNVTKADLQPAPKSIAGNRNVAITVAALQPVPKAIGLNWTTSGPNWTLSVNAATIQPFLYDVVGRRGTPVITANPTLVGQTINLAYRRAFVIAANPAFAGKTIALQENHFFVRGAPLLSGKTIGLRKGTPVISASLSLSGKSITLTLGASPIYQIVTATPTIAGQSIGLNLTFSLATATTALSILGQNVEMQWRRNDATNVSEAHPVLSPKTIVLNRAIRISSTAFSLSGQAIAFKYDWIFPIDIAAPGIAGQEIGLSFSYTLGYTFSPAQVSFATGNIVLYLGDGQPRQAKVSQSSEHIQIQLKAPIMVNQKSSQGMTGVQS